MLSMEPAYDSVSVLHPLSLPMTPPSLSSPLKKKKKDNLPTKSTKNDTYFILTSMDVRSELPKGQENPSTYEFYM